jgi:uncharacterized membrane protein YkvA (DUF1232 family)
VATDDPFPSEAFGGLVRRLPRYAKLAFALGRDPSIARARRAAVLGGAAYLVSPIDLVPGIVPVLGQLDDLLVVLIALKVALDGLEPTRRRRHLAAVGLAEEDLAADMRTVGSTTAWLARRGVRLGARAATVGARAAGRATLAVGRAGRSAFGAGRRRLAARREAAS